MKSKSNDAIFGKQHKSINYLQCGAHNIHLTKREVEVMGVIIKGFSAKTASQLLGISNRTVEKHIEILKDKFCCRKKNEIILLCIKNNLIGQFVDLSV